MKKLKFTVLFLMLLSFSYSNAAKYKYWLVIKDSSYVYKDSKGTKYVYPQKDYTYMVKTNSNIQGSGVGEFTINITNGKVPGSTPTQIKVNENIEFSVQWNDVVDTCIVKIDKATAYVPNSDTLNAFSPIKFSYRVASLKGQTPAISISSNPPIGNKQNITAQILTEATYPNLYMPYNILTGWVNIPAEYYEWTLPVNWTAAGQNGSTFILGSNQKSITITPDYVTAGEIKVRALNALKTAGSETKSNTLDRGFAFTNYPTSITFGDNSTKTFSAPLFNGITYEWSAPVGWQINGQGNTLEALNLNSVSVAPTFCSQTDGRVRVRLKKDGDVSGWYDCTSYQGIIQPNITANNPTIYQYDEATFSITNINAASIQSINCLDNGVCFVGSLGSSFKIRFLESGTFTKNISILMTGCSTPKTFPITITVQPHPITLSGPSQICDQGTYTINNLPSGATVAWSSDASVIFKVLSGNGTASATYYIDFRRFLPTPAKVIAKITINCQDLTLTKDVQLGTATPEYWMIELRDGVPTTVNAGVTGVPLFFQIKNVPLSPVDNNYHWTIFPPENINGVDPQFNTIDTGQQISYMGRIPGTYTISMQYNGVCGWSSESTSTFNLSGEIINLALSVYPNPATDLLNISLTGQNETETSSLLLRSTSIIVEPYTIQLWNERYGLVRTIESSESNLQISLQGLPKGMYFLHLIRTGKNTQKKLFWIK